MKMPHHHDSLKTGHEPMRDKEFSFDLRQVVYALSDALDLVGVDDVAHGKRVGIMCANCASVLGWSQEQQDLMFDLGMLHDIGVSSTQTHLHLLQEFAWPGSQEHAELGYQLRSEEHTSELQSQR